MSEGDADRANAERASRLNELGLAECEHLAAHESGDPHPAESDEDEDECPHSAAALPLEDGAKEEDHEEAWDHEEDVGEAHEERVDAATEESGDHPDEGADADPAEGGEEADRERGLAAVHHERQHVELQQPRLTERATPSRTTPDEVDDVGLRHLVEVERQEC